MIAEHERTEGQSADAFEALDSLKEKVWPVVCASSISQKILLYDKTY